MKKSGGDGGNVGGRQNSKIDDDQRINGWGACEKINKNKAPPSRTCDIVCVSSLCTIYGWELRRVQSPIRLRPSCPLSVARAWTADQHCTVIFPPPSDHTPMLLGSQQ